jgi:2-polyprenyl-6-methoxyphenol hydroxylase-like FAD-dependent oxidoreductase
MSKRALVIGGSLGGLIAAHLLRSVGWDAVVYERNAEDLVGRGAGIGTHQHLIDILRRVGIAFDDSMGVRVGKVLCLDRDGSVVLEQDTVRVMSGWARLHRSLREALPADRYRLGHGLVRVEQDADGVTAVFADGSRARGDLLVGADGIRSTVRAQALPDAQPVYAGYVAWRAMLDERDVPPDSRDVFECYTFCLPEGEQCLGYPVPGRDNDTAAGRRAYNIVWYRPTDPATTLVDLCTDAAGRNHGMAIPPPLIRPDVVAAIKATARALVAPQVAAIFARS